MIIVHIDAGLGNQMLLYCEYLALKQQNPNERIFIETIIYEIPEANQYIKQWNGYEVDKIFNLNTPNIKSLFNENEWQIIIKEIRQTKFWEKNWNYPVYITKILNKHGLNLKNTIGDFEQNYKIIIPKDNKWPLKYRIKKTRPYDWVRRIYRKCKSTDKYIDTQNLFYKNKKSENIYTGGRLSFMYKGNNIDKINKSIRETFIFPPDTNQLNIELKKELSLCNSIAIHARRGDSLQNNSIYYKNGYFKRATKYIKNNISNPTFYFFCDPGSIEWCKQNIKIFGLSLRKDKIKFVDWNTNEQSFRDMELMSYCKHNIITFSSFGWWATFLNRNPNKITISPELHVNTTHSK